MLNKVVLTFESVEKILKCDISNASYQAVFSRGTLFITCMLYKVVLMFESVDEIPKCDFQMKATEQYFPLVLFIMLYKLVLTFESVGEVLKCDQSNASY